MEQAKSHRWTWAEFSRLPESKRERYEVIAGELYVTPAPTTRHQLVATALTRILSSFTEDHGLGWVMPGPVDVLLGEGDYLEPDLVFVHEDRRDLITNRGIEGPPDLVVEILSTSTQERDRGLKRERYARFGVPEYWIVDPLREGVHVIRPAEERGEQRLSPGDTFTWQPAPDGPVLRVDVADLLPDFS